VPNKGLRRRRNKQKRTISRIEEEPQVTRKKALHLEVININFKKRLTGTKKAKRYL